MSQDQADARYAPLVHAAAAQRGGPDAVTVTALAGYPGGTTTFLRADGTFASASAGAPAAHKTTHENGGSDALTALAPTVITPVTGPSVLGRSSSTGAAETFLGAGLAVVAGSLVSTAKAC